MKPTLSIFALVFSLFLTFPANATMKYVSIPGSAFLPFDQTLSYDRVGTDLDYHGSAALSVFYAPLHLPDGAQLTTFALSVSLCGDCDGGCEVTIRIMERNMGTNDENVLRAFIQDQARCTLVTDPQAIVPVHTIDNETNVYYVVIEGLEGGEFNPNLVNLRAVRIEYYMSAALIP